MIGRIGQVGQIGQAGMAPPPLPSPAGRGRGGWGLATTALAVALAFALQPSAIALQRVVKDDFEGYASQEALGRSWFGTGVVVEDGLNHTPGGKRAIVAPARKGSMSLRRTLSETPSLGRVGIWVHDNGEPAEAWSLTVGNGVTGDTLTVYTVPWSPSGGKQLNLMQQVSRVPKIGEPSGSDREPGWHRLEMEWAKDGCRVMINSRQAWTSADLTEGFTYVEVGRIWGEDQPYEARHTVAWDDLDVRLQGEPDREDMGPIAALVRKPDYAHGVLRQGAWRDRPLDGRSFWAMNYFGGDAPGGRPAKEVLEAARLYGLGDAWYTWGNFDESDMNHLRQYASDPGPLLVTTDPEGMQRLTYRVTPDREARIAELDAVRKGRLVAALHGEWDNAMDHFFGGYPSGTDTRKQAYEAWREHYGTVLENCKGRIVSVNGYGFYQHYAAEWGSDRLVGVEVCENIPGTQPHFAFTRGAARQYGLSWYAQMSPWFAGTILSYDRFSPWKPGHGSGTWGPTHGHSVNMLERHWYAAWLGGANAVCAEANGWNAFDLYNADGTPKLSPLGEAWRKFVAFANKNRDRGIAVTPFAAVLDRYNGFNGGEMPWRRFERTQGDEMATDLFNQFYPGTFDRGLMARNQGYLTPTPYGDTLDALLSDASIEILASYPVIFCVGDFEQDAGFAARLREAARRGSTVVIHRQHARGPLAGVLKAEGARRMEGLSAVKVGKGLVLVIEREPLRAPRSLTKALARAVLPFEIRGRAQCTLARTQTGWMIGLINNDGVYKPSPTSAAVVDPTAATKATLVFPTGWSGQIADLTRGARLSLLTPRSSPGRRSVEVTLGPGEVRVLRVTEPVRKAR